VPALSRANYQRELIASIFFPIALAAVEGSVAAVLVKNAYTGVVGGTRLALTVGLIGSAGEVANLSSFLWVALAHGRRKVRFIATLQAVVIAMVFRVVYGVGASDLLPAILWKAVETNLVLAFFNLIPIPPLDGGNVLAGLVPESAARVLDQVRQFGFIALYALMLSGILGRLIMPPTDFFMRLLLL